MCRILSGWAVTSLTQCCFHTVVWQYGDAADWTVSQHDAWCSLNRDVSEAWQSAFSRTHQNFHGNTWMLLHVQTNWTQLFKDQVLPWHSQSSNGGLYCSSCSFSSFRPDNHFLEAICCFPMVYFMAGTIDKYVVMVWTLFFLFQNEISTL